MPKLTQRQVIAEQIEKIRQARRAVELCLAEEAEAARPTMSDLTEIPRLYLKFREVCDPKNRDNKMAFILIAVWLYSPASLVRGNIARRGLRHAIARVLCTSGSSVSVYFGNARSLFFTHPLFRAETERLCRLLCGD